MEDNTLSKEWYVVNTYAGHEKNVKDNLEMRIKNDHLEDLIFQIIVAEEEEIDFKNGKQITKVKNLFPGYLFCQMIMTDDIWYIVRNTPGVTGFIGSSGGGAKPFSVPAEEIESILRRLGKMEQNMVVNFAEGDRVRVLAGPFANMEGTVESMDNSTKSAKVLVIMFGRETQAEIDYVDLEKAD